MRRSVFYIVITFSLSSYGQMSSINDTVRINEIVVNGHHSSSVFEGYKIIAIDSSILKEYSHNTLSEIIAGNTPIFIKSYGSGGIATTSFRGTGASHTQLAWNEININSPMLGQSDLALIPAGFIDDIQVFYGSASQSVNYGGLGGIINVETKPSWKRENNILVDLGSGSFGRYSGLIKVKTGNNDFQSVTKAFMQSAENNFRFINTVISNDPVEETRRNAQTDLIAFMQELYFKKGKGVTSAQVWYQKSGRNLPGSMLVRQSNFGEKQNDEFFHSIINHKRYNEYTDFNFSVSWLSDNLNYLNPLASIDSRNKSNTFIMKGGLETSPGEKIRIKIVINDELNFINSNNYKKFKTRNISTFTVSVKKPMGYKIGAVMLVRQMLNNKKLLIPDFSTGCDFRIFDNKDYYLKANISRNSKIPTMNDMYWNPGGNTNLKNEFSYTGELAYAMSGIIAAPFSYKTELTLFSNTLKDMIYWKPGTSGYWSPSNIKNVRTAGIETTLNLSFTGSSMTLKFDGQYAFNKAHTFQSDDIVIPSGKQLVYVPMHQFTGATRVYYRNLHASWITTYTGKRFIAADNSQYLNGFLLNNVITGLKLKSGNNSFDLSIKIENLFNINYQAIAYYPMPGRSFLLTIVYQFIK